VSKKIIDPQVAVRHRVEDAMKYAQAIEDGYEWPDELEIEGVGTLVAGRLFQISKPDVDGKHVRDLGWYQVRLIMKQAPHKVGKDFGYWGTQGTYLIQSKGPFNKNGTEKSRCRQIGFNIGEGATGICETRIWKIAKGRETPNSQGVKLVKPVGNARAEKYADFEEWAAQHEGEQFSTSDLAEKSGFSQQTVLKYLKTSAHFTKIKSGWYECGKNQTV
tara:strand:- start:127 stop:780 length:654 start_codon:yes stop_codon:yes gene_type:complete